jgi:hypothetical protein
VINAVWFSFTGSDICVTQTGPLTKNPTQPWTIQSCICYMVVTRHSLKNTVTSVSHVHIDPWMTQIMRTISDIFVLNQSLDPVTVRVVWHFVTVSSVWVYKIGNRMLGAILLSESELLWNLIVQRYLWVTAFYWYILLWLVRDWCCILHFGLDQLNGTCFAYWQKRNTNYGHGWRKVHESLSNMVCCKRKSCRCLTWHVHCGDSTVRFS